MFAKPTSCLDVGPIMKRKRNTHLTKKLIKKEEIKIVMKSSDADLFAFLGAGDIGLEVQSIKHNFIFQ